MHGLVTVRYLHLIFAILHGRPPTRSAFDSGECHVTAYQPVSEAAQSWSYDSQRLLVFEHMFVCLHTCVNAILGCAHDRSFY